MTKTTSAIRATLKIIVLIPLFSGIVFLSVLKKWRKNKQYKKQQKQKLLLTEWKNILKKPPSVSKMKTEIQFK